MIETIGKKGENFISKTPFKDKSAWEKIKSTVGNQFKYEGNKEGNTNEGFWKKHKASSDYIVNIAKERDGMNEAEKLAADSANLDLLVKNPKDTVTVFKKLFDLV